MREEGRDRGREGEEGGRDRGRGERQRKGGRDRGREGEGGRERAYHSVGGDGGEGIISNGKDVEKESNR